MIKEVGTVVKLEGDIAWVETKVTSTCNACSAKSNCGTSSIAKAFGDKSVVNPVLNAQQAQLGDRVEIGIPENNLVVGAALVYLLPLLCALTVALTLEFWLIQFIEINEPLLILLTFAGGALGFGIAKYKVNAAESGEYKAQLLNVLPSAISVHQLD